MEVLAYVSCMGTAYVRRNPPPKQPYKVQYLQFWYLKLLVTWPKPYKRDAPLIINMEPKIYPQLKSGTSSEPSTSMTLGSKGRSLKRMKKHEIWISSGGIVDKSYDGLNG